MDSLRLIYFSPTGSTRTVLEAIADGMKAGQLAITDLTGPASRRACRLNMQEDLALVGVPVYAQRVPGVIREWFAQVQGNGRPAVAVCVYGNIHYGAALRELQELCIKAGFKVVAGAAIIARHSFSCSQLAVAQGRPDARDMENARAFGLAVADKVEAGGAEIGPLPGRLSLIARMLPPNGERLVTRQPVAGSSCTGCGTCVSVCPMGAISPASLEIDENLCLRCFACVGNCPVQARSIEFRRKLVIKNFLRLHGRRRKEPEFYL